MSQESVGDRESNLPSTPNYVFSQSLTPVIVPQSDKVMPIPDFDTLENKYTNNQTIQLEEVKRLVDRLQKSLLFKGERIEKDVKLFNYLASNNIELQPDVKKYITVLIEIAKNNGLNLFTHWFKKKHLGIETPIQRAIYTGNNTYAVYLVTYFLNELLKEPLQNLIAWVYYEINGKETISNSTMKSQLESYCSNLITKLTTKYKELPNEQFMIKFRLLCSIVKLYQNINYRSDLVQLALKRLHEDATHLIYKVINDTPPNNEEVITGLVILINANDFSICNFLSAESNKTTGEMVQKSDSGNLLLAITAWISNGKQLQLLLNIIEKIEVDKLPKILSEQQDNILHTAFCNQKYQPKLIRELIHKIKSPTILLELALKKNSVGKTPLEEAIQLITMQRSPQKKSSINEAIRSVIKAIAKIETTNDRNQQFLALLRKLDTLVISNAIFKELRIDIEDAIKVFTPRAISSASIRRDSQIGTGLEQLTTENRDMAHERNEVRHRRERDEPRHVVGVAKDRDDSRQMLDKVAKERDELRQLLAKVERERDKARKERDEAKNELTRMKQQFDETNEKLTWALLRSNEAEQKNKTLEEKNKRLTAEGKNLHERIAALQNENLAGAQLASEKKATHLKRKRSIEDSEEQDEEESNEEINYDNDIPTLENSPEIHPELAHPRSYDNQTSNFGKTFDSLLQAELDQDQSVLPQNIVQPLTSLQQDKTTVALPMTSLQQDNTNAVLPVTSFQYEKIDDRARSANTVQEAGSVQEMMVDALPPRPPLSRNAVEKNNASHGGNPMDENNALRGKVGQTTNKAPQNIGGKRTLFYSLPSTTNKRKKEQASISDNSALSRSSFKVPVTREPKTSESDRRQIGRLGERIMVEALCKHYQDEHQAIVSPNTSEARRKSSEITVKYTKEVNGISTSKQVTIKWHNQSFESEKTPYDFDTFSPHDITLQIACDDKEYKIRYLEVKTTSMNPVDVSLDEEMSEKKEKSSMPPSFKIGKSEIAALVKFNLLNKDNNPLNERYYIYRIYAVNSKLYGEYDKKELGPLLELLPPILKIKEPEQHVFGKNAKKLFTELEEDENPLPHLTEVRIGL